MPTLPPSYLPLHFEIPVNIKGKTCKSLRDPDGLISAASILLILTAIPARLRRGHLPETLRHWLCLYSKHTLILTSGTINNKMACLIQDKLQ